MLAAIGLVFGGFLLGVLLAGIGACFIIGIIHREAVSIVDSHVFAMGGPITLGKTPSDVHGVRGAGASHAND